MSEKNADSRWPYAIVVVVGLVGFLVAAIGLYSLGSHVLAAAGVDWVTSDSGLLAFLKFHYDNIKENLTYWWLPQLLRWLHIPYEPWMKDVPTVIGAIGLGLPLARPVVRVHSPHLAQVLSKFPPALHPLVLCIIVLSSASIAFGIPYLGLMLAGEWLVKLLDFGVRMLGDAFPDWLMLSLGSVVELQVTGIIIIVLAFVFLVALSFLLMAEFWLWLARFLYERLALQWLDEFFLEVGGLVVWSLLVSAAFLAVLVAFDWAGVVFQIWASPGV